MVILLTSANTCETDLVSSIVWHFYLLKKQHKIQPTIRYHIYIKDINLPMSCLCREKRHPFFLTSSNVSWRYCCKILFSSLCYLIVCFQLVWWHLIVKETKKSASLSECKSLVSLWWLLDWCYVLSLFSWLM